ncbi:MAG: hypothetical protein GY950_07430 [bacterium]|nr:hypothetical protein [bacterium]
MAEEKKPLKKAIKGRKIPNTAELGEIYNELIKKPNVIGCYVGKKKKGEGKERGLAIVCGVNEKKDKKILQKDDLIPKHVDWLKSSASPQKIRTDVVKMGDKLKTESGPVIGPGDKVVHAASGEVGTVGIAMENSELGKVVTTAGHLFPDNVQDDNVTIRSGDSTVKAKMIKKVINQQADYALLQMTEPANPEVANLFRDLYAVGPLYIPNEEDIGKTMRILTPTEAFEVELKGIHGFFKWPGGSAMSELILTTWKTKGGDSGSCLVTTGFKVCGLLVGQIEIGDDAFSAFAPAYLPLQWENAKLI